VRILVTGAAGYVGSTLTPLLASHGHEVVAIDCDEDRLRRLEAALQSGSHVELHAHTLDDLANKPALFAGVEGVVHLAGISSDAAAELDPELTWHVNVESTAAIGRAAKMAGARRFLFASTAAIYQVPVGRRREHSFLETGHQAAAELLLGVYARSKLAAERQLAELADANFLVVLVRKGSLYGYSPVMRWDLVINRLVLHAWLGRPFLLHDRGVVWRPIAHVYDAARAYLHLLGISPSQLDGGMFSVAERNVRLVDICQEIDTIARQELGRGLILRHGRSPFPQRTGRVSGEEMKRLGWCPNRSLGEGVSELLERLGKWEVGLPEEAVTTAAGVGLLRRAAT
jgi:nucleoside-diphosphate-sugar epimerase